jgi:hypothetical protein
MNQRKSIYDYKYGNFILTIPLFFYISILSLKYTDDNPLNLMFVAVIPITLLVCLAFTIYTLIRIRIVKKAFIKIIILISPILIFPIKKVIKSLKGPIVLETFINGPISGTNLNLYSSKNFELESSSLLGTTSYNGDYETKNDTVLLSFTNSKPEYLKNSKVKMIIKGDGYLQPVNDTSFFCFEIMKNNINSASH